MFIFFQGPTFQDQSNTVRWLTPEHRSIDRRTITFYIEIKSIYLHCHTKKLNVSKIRYWIRNHFNKKYTLKSTFNQIIKRKFGHRENLVLYIRLIQAHGKFISFIQKCYFLFKETKLWVGSRDQKCKCILIGKISISQRKDLISQMKYFK